MRTSHAPLATDIVASVGGTENIESYYHCQTRLRFLLRDEARVDQARLNALDGVATSLSNGGVFQVVVGTHVKDVHDEIERQIGASGATGNASGTESPAVKKGPFGIILDFITGTFMPIIPALSGAGMVKAFLALLVVTGATTRQSQTYYILSFFADAVFFFLPVMLAFSAANKLKSNPILAAGVACIMLHPNWAALVAAKEPVHLFDFIPLTLATYSSTVIPILMIVVVQSYVEKWLTRVIPNAVTLVFVPMFTFLIMGTVAMSLLGPIGSILGGYLASFFDVLSTNAAWAPAVLIGATLPVMVMFGLHTAVGPLGTLQLSQTGFDSIFGPGAVCSNIAVGIASLVVAVRTKERRLRQLATAGGITGLMGITEPALYGVVLPKKYPLIAAMVGGGAGGLYAGLTQTHRFATGSSGLPAVLLYIGDDTMRYFVNIIIALLISAVVTAIVTFALALRFEKTSADAALDHDVAEALDATLPVVPDHPNTGHHATAPGTTATLVPTDVTELTAPCTGTVLALADVADPVFASATMGPGLGIEPAGGVIVSPCTGTVMVAMNSGHAFGIRTDDGIEVLVHVGVDTVTMKGRGFTGAVAQGTRVEAGQPLVTADLAAIAAAGHPATVVLVVTNASKFGAVETIAHGSVISGEPVLTVGR